MQEVEEKVEQSEHGQKRLNMKQVGKIHIPKREIKVLCSRYTEGETIGENEMVVHFTRHGEGYHNLRAYEQGYGCECNRSPPRCPYLDESIMDPKLTETGKEQAAALAETSVDIQMDLVVVSSLSRAIETGLIGYKQHIDKGTKVLSYELCRECCGVHLCDKRRNVSDLKEDYPMVDFTLVPEADEMFLPCSFETLESLSHRSYRLLLWLRELKEQRVAVVTHSTFLLALFNSALSFPSGEVEEQLSYWFKTGERRSVRLQFNKVI